MKLIIDITEEQFKDCQRTLALAFELSPLIESYCTMIVNGIPLEIWFDNIEKDMYRKMAEISDAGRMNDYKRCETQGISMALDILNKYKKEN